MDALLKQPTVVRYQGPATKPENWTLYAKQLDGGTLIVGISEYDYVSGVEESLRRNMGYFGPSFDSAKKIDPNKLDNFIAWCLVDSKGILIAGAGRIPLKTDAILIGSDSKKASSQDLWREKLLRALFANRRQERKACWHNNNDAGYK